MFTLTPEELAVLKKLVPFFERVIGAEEWDLTEAEEGDVMWPLIKKLEAA